MTHTCRTCGKSAPEVKFALQHCSKNLRSVCNLCRSIHDRERRAQTMQPPTPTDGMRDSWLDLCANDRPAWGWNHRHVPVNHNKGQEFQI